MAAMRHDQSGLTITELMIVLAIITVTSILAGAALSRQDNARAVNDFAQHTFVAMRQARTTALESRRVVQIRFRASDGKAVRVLSASLLGEGPPAASVWMQMDEFQSSGARLQAIKQEIVRSNPNPGTGGLTSDANGVLNFNPDGSVTGAMDGSEAGPFSLYFRDESGKHHRRILVFSMTGYSHMLERW